MWDYQVDPTIAFKKYATITKTSVEADKETSRGWERPAPPNTTRKRERGEPGTDQDQAGNRPRQEESKRRQSHEQGWKEERAGQRRSGHRHERQERRDTPQEVSEWESEGDEVAMDRRRIGRSAVNRAWRPAARRKSFADEFRERAER